ncbi:MAG: hypothetical protein KDD64_04465 [Bdellovibrionales bacterium]|nr:hypothetical protein [Bdellovibrionales bacterium]
MMANYKIQSLAGYNVSIGAVAFLQDAELALYTGAGESVLPSDITDSFTPDSIYRDRGPVSLFGNAWPACMALRHKLRA